MPSKVPFPRRRTPPPAPRSEPLPETAPKPLEDDPGAQDRIRQLMQSPAYVRADKDLDLLQQEELRAVRLQLEYLKPEMILSEYGVDSTVVVFGGSRIAEPAAARRQLAAARRALEHDSDNQDLRRKLTSAERVLAKSRHYELAREFSRLVSEACRQSDHCSLTIVTGGGPGIMEAANRGAFDAGSKSVGLNITLPHEQFPNPYVTPELCFEFRYFALRKMHFLLRAKALVVFPGGFGTMDELFETLTLLQTRTIAPLPVVLVGEDFWRQVFDADFLADEGVIDREDIRLFVYADTAQQIWDHIVNWWREAGEDILT
jgi:uncharacterized protein (TIGR00730 family)